MHIAVFYTESLGIGYSWNIYMAIMPYISYTKLMYRIGTYAGRRKGERIIYTKA